MLRKSISVLGLLVFLLVGCTLEYDTTIRSDQSGTFSVGFSYTETDASLLLETIGGSDPLTLCNQLFANAADLPPGMVIRQERKGDQNWCYMEAPFTDLEDLRSFYGENTPINRLEVVDDTFYYDVSYDADNMSILGSVNVIWKVTMPGKVISHNATSISGRTLTWEKVGDGVANMQATSSLTSTTWVWWLVGALVCLSILVVVGAVLVLLVVNNRKRKTAQGGFPG